MEPSLFSLSVTMRPARRGLNYFVLAFGIFLLSFAVFNWGLQYKMSLYQTGTNQAPAKLWTGKTAAAATQSLTADTQRPIFFYRFLVALLVLLQSGCLLPAGRVCFRFIIPWKTHLDVILHAFLFRPPPVTA